VQLEAGCCRLTVGTIGLLAEHPCSSCGNSHHLDCRSYKGKSVLRIFSLCVRTLRALFKKCCLQVLLEVVCILCWTHLGACYCCRGLVAYQEVYESSDMTLGIFMLPAKACIPLHNHPGKEHIGLRAPNRASGFTKA
jgi:hypothetical protein